MQLKYRGYTWSTWLQFFIKRAFDITDDGFGSLNVWYYEADNELGVAGRRYSGLRSEGTKPHIPFVETLVPANVRLMSPFALPSALKEILRMGCGYDDCDLSISHLQVFARRHKIRKDMSTAIGRLLTDPDGMRQEIADSEYGKRVGAKKAKKLPIELLNGSDYLPPGVPLWVLPYAAELKVYHAAEQRDHAADLLKLKNKSHPTRTLTSRPDDNCMTLTVNTNSDKHATLNLNLMSMAG